ncbi:MAG: cadherin domain-containing protein, partial [Acidobacteria bacterium]|nr:cadherin domain-containing protein [Acidobacteriota bacterium]
APRPVPENTPRGIRGGAAIAATTPNEDDTLTYALAGADAAAFRIDEDTGQLRFAKAPDFEQPADKQSTTPANAASNNEYVVNVTVADGKDSAGNAEAPPVVDDTITVTISVTDVDEPGRVSLSTTRPQLGSAVTATLSDPDGSPNPTWKWERSFGRTTWSAIPGATSASYTPVAADAGRFLRATATYTGGNEVKATTSEVVLAHTLSHLAVTTTSSRKMYPAFDAGTLHYAVGCAADADLGLSLSAADANTRVAVNGEQVVKAAGEMHATTTVRVGEDADDVITVTLSGATGAATDYLLYCLPDAFPTVTTTAAQGATGVGDDLFATNASLWQMVIDANGVPRWHNDATTGNARLGAYLRPYQLADGSWRYIYGYSGASNPVRVLDADFKQVAALTTVSPLSHTDHHDFVVLPDGSYILLAYQGATRDLSFLTTKYGLRKPAGTSGSAAVPLYKGGDGHEASTGYADGVAFGTEATTDSALQVRTAAGAAQFTWNSWGNVAIEDCTQHRLLNGYGHINSLDVVTTGNSGFDFDIIAGLRGCSKVYRINPNTGDIVWRVGRSSSTDAQWAAGETSGSGPAPLQILDDPEGEFCGQHAAQLLPNGNLLLYDNGVQCLKDPATGASKRKGFNYSRAVEYALDPASGEAVFQRDHSLHNTKTMLGYSAGHVAPLPNGDWLISWGNSRSGGFNPRPWTDVDESATQVDPATNMEKLSIKIVTGGNLASIRLDSLSPVRLAANVEPLTATILANAGSATHAGASDTPTVVVAFNQPVVDIDQATQSVTVTGATVASVAPHVEAGVPAIAYVFTLTPTGNSAISFNLAASQTCGSARKGICTASGGQLTEAPAEARTITYSAPPKVTLVLMPSTIAESGSSNSTTVTATLNEAVTGATTVTVSAAAGTAGASEFTLSANNILTIAASTTTSTGVVTITAVDDKVDEGDETVTVSGEVTAGTPAAPDDVTLIITDDDEANSAPTFSDGATTTREVAENTSANANVGAAVAATDADSDTLTYSLGGADAGSFSIDTSSGQIQTKDALNHETKSSYTVTVSVHDGKAADGSEDTEIDATITVTVSVTDVNEAPGKPDAPTFGAATASSLVVNWTAPSNSGP